LEDFGIGPQIVEATAYRNLRIRAEYIERELKTRGTKKFDGVLRIERSPMSLQDDVARLYQSPASNGESKMNTMRIVAMPTEVANTVRSTLKAPTYGFPAQVEIAEDAAPCRHCLKTFVAGKDRRILFTYDRFAGVESLPQPGPVYIHADNCERYDSDAFPEEMRNSPRTLEAYAHGRKLIATEYISDGKYEDAIEKLFAHPGTSYIQVNSTTAGCFTFRIQRDGDRSR
jgi:hypothetical protein